MLDKVGMNCCGCGACASACPQGCITMKADGEGFLYPHVDREGCVNCGLCEKACPILNVPTRESADCREAWGVTCKDEELLMDSSSGGAFTVLAREVLAQGGCVFGAVFSEDFKRVGHIKAEREEELRLLRGSKYVQSEINAAYTEAKRELLRGRRVLFSGTPCQIAGLRGYLGRPYEALVCVDIICHGVASPLLWENCLRHMEAKRGPIAAVSFRHKVKGWRCFGLCIEQRDGRYFGDHFRDPYLHMYLKNFCLRESCYGCKIKESGACADITLGDFWGVERISPQLDNEQGVSLALLHTEKGRELFLRALPELQGGRTDFDGAVRENIAYTRSVRRPEGRAVFYSDLQRLAWNSLVRRYGRDTLRVRMKRGAKAILKSLRR